MAAQTPRSVPLSSGGDWHQHVFTPHVDRRESCIVCGRARVWRWHFGPFLQAAYRQLHSRGG